MPQQKFVIVSNRLPVSVSKQDGKLVYTHSPGGLATALSSVSGEAGQKLWIGWPGISSDDLTPGEKSSITRKLLKDYDCYPVFLTAEQVELYYEGYSNDTIWPLFHYFQSFAQHNPDYWKAYESVNNIFRHAVLRRTDPHATIWVQDYHLMLLPQLLRESFPNSTIGFFMHIPLPSYEIFRSLPHRQQILEGLLGADLLGFHIYDYVRHFLSSVQRIVGLENAHGQITMAGRTIKVDAFPIGIDYEKYTKELDSPETRSEVEVLKAHYRGQKVILSVDRLDYSKGILKRLEAYDKFLRKHPKYHKKVVLVMVAVPSRTEVEAYKELREVIEKAVSRINGDYGTVDWNPISYQFKNLPFNQVLALYMRADIALVTPLRDGMNLVAKEFVAAKQKAPGVLILSEMTGAFDELPEALRINPNDIDSMVQAIRTALRMTRKEKVNRLRAMQRRISSYTVQRWAEDFIEHLEESKLVHEQQSKKLLPPDVEDKIVRIYKKSKKRLILLDYDGTLRGYVAYPTARTAAPSPALLEILESIVNSPKTRLCIVSGRPRHVLDTWFAGWPVDLAAEHGAWVRLGGEWSQQQVSLQNFRSEILRILEQFAERTPGAEIEEKNLSLVWHYRNVPTELAYARNASLRYELRKLLGNSGIGVFNGIKIIEIKPEGVHKGNVAEELLAMHPSEFILCVGDDYTDEDMFRVLPEEAYTIRVGLGDTAARYQVLSTKDVLRILRKLS